MSHGKSWSKEVRSNFSWEGLKIGPDVHETM